MKKNGVICLVSMFPSWVMVLKLPKKAHFFQFCANLSKKSKSIKVIYIIATRNNIKRKTPIFFNLRNYVEKQCNGP